MIGEQELAAAIVAVEQSIRDGEEGKQKFKQDGARLKELSIQLTIDKTKLQVLHWAQGITRTMTGQEVESALNEINTLVDKLHAPVETDLFQAADTTRTDAAKDLERQKLIARTKQFTLRFLAGVEKKIL